MVLIKFKKNYYDSIKTAVLKKTTMTKKVIPELEGNKKNNSSKKKKMMKKNQLMKMKRKRKKRQKNFRKI